MSNQQVFIGRDKELQMVDSMIFDPSGANHVWPIIGEAGVGKTCLLKEIYQRYRQDPRVIVITIDHSQARGHNLPQLAIDLFQQFTSYMSKESLSELFRQLPLAQFTSTNVDFNNISDDQVESFMFRLQLLLKLTGRKRIVVLSDALDARISTEMTDYYMMIFGSTLRNVVMISAGRPTESVMSVFKNHDMFYAQWNKHQVYNLAPFSQYESNEYFYKTLPATIGTDLPTKTFFLTGGHPVLMSIGGEWLKHHINLPEDVDRPLIKLQFMDKSELAKLRRKFEYVLIDKVRGLREGALPSETVDLAMLYLTYLNRRYDPKILQLVLGIENKAVLKTIIKEVKSSVFVRQFLSAQKTLVLHDEAQRLIGQYVWPVVDPDQTLRRELAQKVIDGYYLPEIERLNRIVRTKLVRAVEQKVTRGENRISPTPDEIWLKHELQLECMDYYFRISADAGWNYFDQLLAEALTYHYPHLQMDGIMDAVQRVAPKEQVDSLQFQVRRAQTLLHKEQFEQAATLAQSALDSPEITPANATVALIVLARSATDPSLKFAHLQKAVKKAQAAQNNLLEAEAYFELGRAYEQRGWCPQATAEYQRVLGLLDKQKHPNEVAVTLNNLASVTMLSGNPAQADNIAEKALRIRKQEGNVHGLSLSYATKGHIAHALGDYVWAGLFHRTAVDLAKSVGDHDNVLLFQTNVAAVERHDHNFKGARELLEAGLESQQPHIRAHALYQAADVDIYDAKLQKQKRVSRKKIARLYDSAQQKIKQALTLAQQVGNDYLAATILFDGALLSYFRQKQENQEYIQALQELLSKHDYRLNKGRLVELLGDIAYAKGDLSTAFEHYLEACQILAQYSQATFRQTFVRVRSKFLDAPAETQTQIAHIIQTKYAQLDPTSPLVALLGLTANELTLY